MLNVAGATRLAEDVPVVVEAFNRSQVAVANSGKPAERLRELLALQSKILEDARALKAAVAEEPSASK